nr:glycerophosphocholine cholinephosphodiesterase ENPP6-like [Parasteatoda tepidariorum]
MKATFIAMGPDLRGNLKPQPFDIIDIYNLMCHLLKIEPLPNNGTWEHVEPLLRTAKDPPFHHSSSASHHPILILIIIMVAVLFPLFTKTVL